VLAVKVLAFTVLLADQHRKRSRLAGASTCFWIQGTEYHLQQVAQNAQFQPVLGTGGFFKFFYFFFTATRETFAGKNRRMPVC